MVKILKDSFLWAIQDQSADWYLDAKTGEVRSDLEGFGDDGEPGPEDDERWIEIDRLMPTESFEFMEDFVSELGEGAAREEARARSGVSGMRLRASPT